jgi:hypothetical protein
MEREIFFKNLITDFLVDNYTFVVDVGDITYTKSLKDSISIDIVLKLDSVKTKELVGNDLYDLLFSKSKIKDLFSVRWFLKDYIDLNQLREEIKKHYKMLFSERIHNFNVYLEIVHEG